MTDAFANDSAWKPVKIGAGGWITGIDVAPDGTMIARTDTYGAYLWTGTSWSQLATANSMPSNVFFSAGVYEIRVAASNSNIFYMEMGDGIYKTTDKGQNWVKTSFPITTSEPNLNNRMDGQKMAIDPTNPDIVFAGTQHNGLWVTRDGGSTWQQVTAVPQGTNTTDPGLTGIVIQGSIVFVGTAGSGVYASTDGGHTWQAIGGPADVSHGVISADGSYYASGNTDTALWKYADGAWTKIIESGVHAVAVDPFNPAHIVVTNDGGGIRESKDGGATWSEWNHASQLESSNDIPWLENSGGYMSSGGLVFDPLVPGQLWQSAGVGVWETRVPDVLNWNTPVVWNSHSMGIEQLVTNEILAPAGGDPIFASWDRPFFTMNDVDSYASSYSGGQFSMGWSIDYASTNSQFIVGISDWCGVENSGFSTDGGHTWERFAGLPAFAMESVGGNIAASSPTNIIWAPAGGHAPAYTLDGGATWQTIEIAGKTDWAGFHQSYYLTRTTVTADRVLPNTFYLYDVESGVYRSSDGGANWTQVFSGPVAEWSYWNTKMEAVPGRAGELYFTSGPQGSDTTVIPGLINFMHSTDGGATWQAVAGVQTSIFGYGAAATPGGPATVFIVGTVNGMYGVWYSADEAQTWTQIGDHPMGSLDGIKTISGDMDTFGLVYIGFGGSGYAYLQIGDTPSPTPLPTPVPTDGIELRGNDQDNVLLGTGTNDQIFGNGGNDTLTGGGNFDSDDLSGGAGNDTFLDTTSGLNGDTITDFASGDKIVFSDATLSGFTYSLVGSVLTYTGGSLTLTGGVSGALVASAAAGGGVQLEIQPIAVRPVGSIEGSDGNDTLRGGKGNDTIYGGRGNDIMSGGRGADKFVIEAVSGADRITDFTHSDRVVFDASSGVTAFSQLVFTAVGRDTKISWGSGDSLTIQGFRPDNLTAADFTFSPSPASNSTIPTVPPVVSLPDEVELRGNDQDNVLVGSGTNDQIFGNGGNDTLKGGGGNDTIYGGQGNDIMSGGRGADKFVIEAVSGADRITDFTHADRVVFDASSGVTDFSQLVFTAVGRGTKITWGTTDSLTITGIKPAGLSGADFTFSPPAASSFSIIAVSNELTPITSRTSDTMVTGTSDESSRPGRGGESREPAGPATNPILSNLAERWLSLDEVESGHQFSAWLLEPSADAFLVPSFASGAVALSATGGAIRAPEAFPAAISGIKDGAAPIDGLGVADGTAGVWRGVADQLEPADDPFGIDALLASLPSHAGATSALVEYSAEPDVLSALWMPAPGPFASEVILGHPDAIGMS